MTGLTITIPEEGVRDVSTDKVSYLVVHDRATNFWTIKSKDGVLPQSLLGAFTSPQVASLAIKNYSDLYEKVQKAASVPVKESKEK